MAKLVRYICDGCGKEEISADGWKPEAWFQRTDKDSKEEMHACCRGCVEAAAKKKGATNVIAPF